MTDLSMIVQWAKSNVKPLAIGAAIGAAAVYFLTK